ncbi:MATE family efflux transporter [Oscillospiraceae bacterium OttesenSCG-928-F05]|nr:MATE family efflux transporter [Oscillospiraceae bacterium OttesenSCG-928-F05]
MTNKRLFGLYWPILVEQTLTVLVGMVSSVLVAGIGEYAVSGVNLVDSINYMVINVLNAFSAGVTAVVARAFGRGDGASASRTAGQSQVLITGLSTLVGLITLVFGKQIFYGLYGGAAADVLSSGRTYFLFSAMSYPFVGLFASSAGIMRGSGNSRTPMLASALSNVVNIGVAAPLIFFANLGVVGAGLGMLAARIVSAVFLYVMLERGQNRIVMPKFSLKIQWENIKPVVDIGLPSGIDSMIFNGSKVVVATMLSGMGTAAIMANTIAVTVTNLMNLPGMAFSTAVVTVVGQSYGARQYQTVRKQMLKVMGLTSVSVTLCSVLIWLFIDGLIGLYNPSLEAAQLAKTISFGFVVLSPFTWAPGFMLPQALRAVGDAKYCLVFAVLSLFVLRVFGSWFLGVYLDWGVVGIWASMYADWIGRAAAFLPRALSGKWFKGPKADFIDHPVGGQEGQPGPT